MRAMPRRAFAAAATADWFVSDGTRRDALARTEDVDVERKRENMVEILMKARVDQLQASVDDAVVARDRR